MSELFPITVDRTAASCLFRADTCERRVAGLDAGLYPELLRACPPKVWVCHLDPAAHSVLLVANRPLRVSLSLGRVCRRVDWPQVKAGSDRGRKGNREGMHKVLSPGGWQTAMEATGHPGDKLRTAQLSQEPVTAHIPASL